MKSLRKFTLLSALLVAMLACSLFTPAAPSPVTVTEPPVTPAMPAPTDTPVPTAVNGIPVSFSGTSFVIPDGLGNGAGTEIVPESVPQNGQDLPYFAINPAYVHFTLQGYPLQGKFLDPQLYVYPVQEFSQINEGAAQIISDLQTLLANPSNPLPSQLPFLPLFNAAQMFSAEAQIISFQNGAGVRFLTQYGQAYYPVNNKYLFYTFQGLTSDGKYYVAAILPINAAFLAADENPASPIPQDGIPFNMDQPQQYFDAVIQKLNSTDPNTFTPGLPSLDALIQSITVSGMQ
jgi:hypothetical protein